MSEKNKPNEIYITRIYDAPVKLVWEAWTDPKKAALWWGPRGFTITTHSKELRVGGHWDYTMHGPDGVNYPNKTKYFEVETMKRLVYDHGANDDQPALFRVTVDFTELNGKTKMEMVMALATAEAAIATKKFIKEAGGDATWDRLAEFLSENDRFVINRSFTVNIAKMFEMWTDPKNLSKWVPPTGFNMSYIEANIKVGGESFYCMFNDSNMKMHGKAKYLEIKEPNRIVYTQEFCDENKNTTRHPMAPTWPATMLTTVTLCDEGKNTTRVTIEWEVFGDATDAERSTFNQAKPGMTIGWTGSLDKLENYLATK